MNIAAREIGPEEPPYVIAEIGVNHDGSVGRALELVDVAAAAGADAVKLQLFDSARLLGRCAGLATYQRRGSAGDPHSMLQSLQLTVEQSHVVAKAAGAAGLHAIVTIFNVQLVGPAMAVPWDALKTASPDIVNRPLIEELLATGRPLLVSAGAASMDEIAQVTQWLGGPPPHPHVLMQCVSAYPTPDEQAHLAARQAMCAINPCALGYSDHTTSIDTGALAVASGARVLEKHITHDRGASGPDHAVSLDPRQFAEYVRLAHRAFAMVGRADKSVLAIEQDVRTQARQSLTTTRPLAAGHVLTERDLAIKRPGTGIAPARLKHVIGRRIARTIDADVPLTEEHLS